MPQIPDGSHDGVLDGDAERLRDLASEAPIVRLLTRLIAAAVEREASDIHIEPVLDHIQVRFRIDGALQLAEQLDKPLQMGLTSRVKILARLNIAEQRLPQDGRIRFPVKGNEIDFRVSTSPTLYGESVVLRILDRRELAARISRRSVFRRRGIDQLRRLITSPNGIVLVTGPTGSGKTTTLYAALSRLNQPERKLFTVEDPIEYHLKGVNQILVRPQIGLDFAAVLRSILRQDPDIIMVGEIRDGETARIAVQAALTGTWCSRLFTPIRRPPRSPGCAISVLTAFSWARLCAASWHNGWFANSVRIARLQPIAVKSKRPRNHVPGAYRPVGCPHCNGTGYRGRTVIYELLEITETLTASHSHRAARGRDRSGCRELTAWSCSPTPPEPRSLRAKPRWKRFTGRWVPSGSDAHSLSGTRQRRKVTQGVLDAESLPLALEQLRRQGVTPFLAEPAGDGQTGRFLGFGGSLAKTSLAWRAQFIQVARHCLPPAFRSTGHSPSSNRKHHPAIKAATEQHPRCRHAGQPLSAGLASRETGFQPDEIGLVKAGEQTGSLVPVLEDLGRALERRQELKGKIISTLIYPAFLLALAPLSLAIIAIILVPSLEPLFENSRAAMPLVLRFLSVVSRELRERALLWLAAALAHRPCSNTRPPPRETRDIDATPCFEAPHPPHYRAACRGGPHLPHTGSTPQRRSARCNPPWPPSPRSP